MSLSVREWTALFPPPHIIQVPGLQVLVLQVFTDVAPWSENAVGFLMDLPLLIVTLNLWNHVSERDLVRKYEWKPKVNNHELILLCRII